MSDNIIIKENENKSVEQSLRMLRICAYGMGLKPSDDFFRITDMDIPLNTLLQEDTLAPVIIALADMHYDITQMDSDFNSFFPVNFVKHEDSLCFIKLDENSNFKLENSGFSLLVSSLYSLDIMTKLLMKNNNNKVELTHLVDCWRDELSSYKEGEIINIRNHKERLIDGNLSLYPKMRIDLKELRKTDLRKGLFK